MHLSTQCTFLIHQRGGDAMALLALSGHPAVLKSKISPPVPQKNACTLVSCYTGERNFQICTKTRTHLQTRLLTCVVHVWSLPGGVWGEPWGCEIQLSSTYTYILSIIASEGGRRTGRTNTTRSSNGIEAHIKHVINSPNGDDGNNRKAVRKGG